MTRERQTPTGQTAVTDVTTVSLDGSYGPYAGAFDAENPKSKNNEKTKQIFGHEIKPPRFAFFEFFDFGGNFEKQFLCFLKVLAN